MKYYLLLLSLWFTLAPGTAQRGAMTFSMTEFQLSDSLADQMDTLAVKSGLPLESMFKNIRLTVYFKPDFTRSEVEILNGVIKLNYFWDRKQNEVMLFSDVFGRRTKVKMDPIEMEGLNAEDIPTDKLQVEHFYQEKKTIMGLPVHRVRVATDAGGMGIDLYVCPTLKIPFVGYGIEQMTTDLLGGTPLGYRFKEGPLMIQFEVTRLENQVSDKVFSFPGGYTEKTMEEYLQEFGSFLH